MTETRAGRIGIVIHQIKLPDTSEGGNIVLLKKFILFAGKEQKGKGFVTSTKIEKTINDHHLDKKPVATVEVKILFHEKDGAFSPHVERGRIIFARPEIKAVLGNKELYWMVNREIKKEIGRQIRDIVEIRRERKKKKIAPKTVEKELAIASPQKEEPQKPKNKMPKRIATHLNNMRLQAQARIRDAWRRVARRGRPGTRGK